MPPVGSSIAAHEAEAVTRPELTIIPLLPETLSPLEQSQMKVMDLVFPSIDKAVELLQSVPNNSVGRDLWAEYINLVMNQAREVAAWADTFGIPAPQVDVAETTWAMFTEATYRQKAAQLRSENK